MANQMSVLGAFYTGWETYQGYLEAAVAPLSEAQLALSAGPGVRPVGSLVAHIVGARARWLHDAIGEGGPELATLTAWGGPADPPHSPTELVAGLRTTWQALRDALDRWTPVETGQPFQRERHGETRTLTRQWIVWHLIEHDLHHGGEVSYALSMHDLPGLDI